MEKFFPCVLKVSHFHDNVLKMIYVYRPVKMAKNAVLICQASSWRCHRVSKQYL